MKIHKPRMPGRNDDTTRIVPDETHVYRLTARLVKWKHETGQTGDDDYHLVLTDDTLQYTDEHNGVPVTRHSLIGEVVNPDCLPGRNGDFGTDSAFLPVAADPTLSIANARQDFEQEFPDADYSGNWNDAGGISVEIVAVGFFDRAHQQTGRAPNNLEMHPIVSIKFLQDAEDITPVPEASLAAPRRGPQTPKTGEKPIQSVTGTVTTLGGHNSGRSGNLSAGVSSPDLGYPRTMTVCWQKSSNGELQVSIDKKNWITVRSLPETGCAEIPPVHFVRLTNAGGFYQVSY